MLLKYKSLIKSLLDLGGEWEVVEQGPQAIIGLKHSHSVHGVIQGNGFEG